MPVWGIAFIVGVALAVVVFFTTTLNQQPKFHWIFAYLGFLVSVVWIYTIANEIVNILTVSDRIHRNHHSAMTNLTQMFVLRLLASF